MKIALCFYGQPRFHKNIEISHFLQTLKESEHTIEVYMHLWKPKSERNYIRSPWTNIEDSLAIIDDYGKLEDSIRQTYSPISLEIEDERDLLKFSPSLPVPNLEIVHRMFYSVYRVAELLKKSGKTYDLVIKLRTDSATMSLPPFEKLSEKKIWVPDTMINHSNIFNRSFSISSQENFYKIADAYTKLDELCEKNSSDRSSENLLKMHLSNLGLLSEVKRNRFINAGLVRGENPKRLQTVWINDEFHQQVQM